MTQMKKRSLRLSQNRSQALKPRMPEAKKLKTAAPPSRKPM